MKLIEVILKGVLIVAVWILTMSGMAYWVEYFTHSKSKVIIHQGFNACSNCGNNNVADSVSFSKGNMTMYFGKAKGTTMHISTWVDTLTIKTFAK